MSLEAQITDLNTNIKALTAAIIAATGAAGSSSASTGTASSASTGETSGAATGGKGKGAGAKKGPSREEVVALLTKIKDEKGAAQAKEIVKTVGGVEKMADIPEAKLKAVFEAATKVIEGADDEGGDEGDL